MIFNEPLSQGYFQIQLNHNWLHTIMYKHGKELSINFYKNSKQLPKPAIKANIKHLDEVMSRALYAFMEYKTFENPSTIVVIRKEYDLSKYKYDIEEFLYDVCQEFAQQYPDEIMIWDRRSTVSSDSDS